MTVALPQARPHTVRDPAAVHRRAGDARTLERVIAGAWEMLASGRTAACPACGGAMVPVPRAALGPAAGCCQGCGSVLS